jgi:hypothetical protein
MGRSFPSVRMEVRALAERWERAARALPGADRELALRMAAMARKHSGEAFYAFSDPLEAAVFSVLLEVLKGREEAGATAGDGKEGPGEGRDAPAGRAGVGGGGPGGKIALAGGAGEGRRRTDAEECTSAEGVAGGARHVDP